MERESGYYWVRKPDSGWQVAFWFSGGMCWFLIADHNEFFDPEFEEIGDRIERKGE